MNNKDILKKNVAKLSFFSNIILIIIKFIAGFISGSFSIMSEALHSSTDCFASFIAYYAVKKSAKSADKHHQFGHGKYEDLSGLIEGILINLAAFFILYEGFRKIITNSYEVLNVDIATIVMGVSVIINIVVSFMLFKVARKTGSIALYADAEHLRTDVYTSFGVALGMILIKITGIHILDSIIAIIVAIFISQTGFKICKKAISNLLDAGIPENEIQLIRDIVKLFKEQGISDYCKIKTRTSGPRKNIELTIYAEGSMTVKESHKICNEIESKISFQFEGKADTLIHIEPLCNIMESL